MKQKRVTNKNEEPQDLMKPRKISKKLLDGSHIDDAQGKNAEVEDVAADIPSAGGPSSPTHAATSEAEHCQKLLLEFLLQELRDTRKLLRHLAVKKKRLIFQLTKLGVTCPDVSETEETDAESETEETDAESGIEEADAEA